MTFDSDFWNIDLSARGVIVISNNNAYKWLVFNVLRILTMTFNADYDGVWYRRLTASSARKRHTALYAFLLSVDMIYERGSVQPWEVEHQRGPSLRRWMPSAVHFPLESVVRKYGRDSSQIWTA